LQRPATTWSRSACTSTIRACSLGADEFMDLVHFGDDEAGNAALGETVKRLLRA
jgi:hypothetical protein